MFKAGILTIGDEILLGEIQDTNSNWLAHRLVETGIDPVLRMSIGDDQASILSALTFARGCCNLLIITGGLGPTRDDITKHCLAAFFQSPLSENSEALAQLEEKLRRRGREMNALVRTQALHPEKAKMLPNRHGTAPGIWFDETDLECISLPGVPYEMQQIFQDEVLPMLQKQSATGFIQHRYFRTACIPETQLSLRLEEIENSMPEGIKLAYLPSGGEVKLRLTGRAENEQSLTEMLNRVAEKIGNVLGEDVYAVNDVPLASVVAEMLNQNGFFLFCQDESIGEKVKQKFREAGVWPELVKELPSNRSGYRISFAKSEEAGSVDICLEFYKENSCSDKQHFSVRNFTQESVFHNMLALRALDMLRRHQKDS